VTVQVPVLKHVQTVVRQHVLLVMILVPLVVNRAKMNVRINAAADVQMNVPRVV
jgi:hypothetical protein